MELNTSIDNALANERWSHQGNVVSSTGNFIITDESDLAIAEVLDDGMFTSDEDVNEFHNDLLEARARLIAAAPDLYRLVKSLGVAKDLINEIEGVS